MHEGQHSDEQQAQKHPKAQANAQQQHRAENVSQDNRQLHQGTEQELVEERQSEPGKTLELQSKGIVPAAGHNLAEELQNTGIPSLFTHTHPPTHTTQTHTHIRTHTHGFQGYTGSQPRHHHAESFMDLRRKLRTPNKAAWKHLLGSPACDYPAKPRPHQTRSAVICPSWTCA